MLSHSVMFYSATPCTIAQQTLLFKELSRHEYWGALPCPPPGDLPTPRFKPVSLMSPALAGGGGFFPIIPPGKPALVEAARANL